MKANVLGIFSLFISSMLLASYGVIIHILGNELNAGNQILFRYLLSLALFVGVLIISRARLHFDVRLLPHLILFGLLLQLDIWCFTQAALQMTLPSLLGYFYMGVVLTGSVLGMLVFREKISIKNGLATLFALWGLSILAQQNNAGSAIYYALFAGLLESITNTLRKYLLDTPKGVIVLAATISILIFTLVESLFIHSPIIVPILPETWFAGILFALFALIVNIALTYGFRTIPLNLGSIIMSTEIVFGAIFSWVFFTILPTKTEMISSSLILAGICLQNIKVNNNSIFAFVRNILET